MTLRQKQSLFASLVPVLIDKALALGFEVTLGETWRSPEEARRLARLGIGIANSNHTRRLAIDLNLFRNGRWLTRTEHYKELGEFWERQHSLCRWGGRFNDGAHFSLEHNGVR